MNSKVLIPRRERLGNLIAEGIDPKYVRVLIPIWSSTRPKDPDAKSALLRPSLLVRSDGSVVYLDVNYSLDTRHLAFAHLGEPRPLPNELREYILKTFPEIVMTDLPTNLLLPHVRSCVDWSVYVNRLTSVENAGLLKVQEKE